MEYLDIVDEQGQPTGEIISRTLAHTEGIRHTNSSYLDRSQGKRTFSGSDAKNAQ